jgi:hypothetical protein
VLRRVAIGKGGEVIVPWVGVAAIAVFSASGEGCFVVALKISDLAFEQERPDLFWRRSEPSEVAETVDGLGAVLVSGVEHRFQGEMVVVDTAKDHDPRIGTLDGSGVTLSPEKVALLRSALVVR